MVHRILTADELRWSFPLSDFADKDLKPAEKDRHGRPGALGQERALSALELGLGIRERGFNIFVVGASGTGRTSTVKELLEARAKEEPTPQDVILLYNFADRDRPHAVLLPPGMGLKIKKRYDSFVEKMLQELEKAFESEGYIERRAVIDAHHQEKTDHMLEGIDKEARARGFLLSRTGTALTLAVADDEGNPLSEEGYEALSDQQKLDLEHKAEELQGGLEEALRRIRALEKETDEQIEKLAREIATSVVRPMIDELKADLAPFARVVAHLDDVQKDVLDRLRRLVPESHAINDGGEAAEAESHHPPARRLSEEEEDGDRDEPALLRYRVNVLVSNAPAGRSSHKSKGGAPVVVETHPTAANLIGRIEHRMRAGEATSTDFLRIKAGALYRANGGYLLLHAQDLLRDPAAWEGLKRALKNRQIELDDPGEPGRMVSMAALRPEPVRLSVKIVLIGTPELYYSLSRGDPDFGKLFKVKVDFDIEMAHSPERIRQYMRFLAGLAAEEKLLPLTLDGAGRVLEHAARICDDQGKLTTRFGEMADLVREASFWAAKGNNKAIERSHVRAALAARAEREGFIELHMREDITRRRIQVETRGAVVGQVNGLTVIDLGSYAFGMPVRITCRTGAGKGEIVDIERETELGGPIHTKGTLILKGILLDRFGRDTPMCLQATLCMEQSYSEVDGDSASLAEVCVMFSSLAQAPLRQDTALTGSIDQRGFVQAVGGVNEKIEGFYRVCQIRDPKGSNQVIIPAANAGDLMLDEDVVQACREGRFKVIAVDTLEDALEVLSGRPWSAGKAPLQPAILSVLRQLAEVQSLANQSPRQGRRAPRPLAKAAQHRRPRPR